MRRTLYDYSGFTLKRINEPQYKHLKLLLFWLVYFALYILTENLIPERSCHVIHCRLDDFIPFCEYFAVFYVGWYLFVAGVIAYTLFYNVRTFVHIQKFIAVTQILAMVCYIVYPSVQHLRPEHFENVNIFTQIMGVIYAVDTPTGITPSLHVAYSIGITSGVLKDDALKPVWKITASVFSFLVCLSVCFVKQHSAVDVFAAVPLCIIAEYITYGRIGRLPLHKKYTGSIRLPHDTDSKLPWT